MAVVSASVAKLGGKALFSCFAVLTAAAPRTEATIRVVLGVYLLGVARGTMNSGGIAFS